MKNFWEQKFKYVFRQVKDNTEAFQTKTHCNPSESCAVFSGGSEASFSVCNCDILDVSSRASCCGGVGVWWEHGVYLRHQSTMGCVPLPETGMGSRMLCLPHLFHVSSSLPLNLCCKALPWQEPMANTGAVAAVLCSDLPVRAKWLSGARFQETSLQIPTRPAGSEIIALNMKSLSADALGFEADLKLSKNLY